MLRSDGSDPSGTRDRAAAGLATLASTPRVSSHPPETPCSPLALPVSRARTPRPPPARRVRPGVAITTTTRPAGAFPRLRRSSHAPPPEDAPAPVALSRRDTLAAASVAFASAVLAARPAPALAAYGASSGSAEETADGPVTFSTFYGAAAPPATYGTLGGTTKDKAKYSYEIPSNWTEEAPSKVEKGAGGQDSRFVLVGSRGATRCSVLTLNRAGEDGAAFDLTDKALAAIAGADSRLQEAITTGEVTSKRSTENGQDYVAFSVSRATTPGSTP